MAAPFKGSRHSALGGVRVRLRHWSVGAAAVHGALGLGEAEVPVLGYASPHGEPGTLTTGTRHHLLSAAFDTSTLQLILTTHDQCVVLPI